jgi:hypothetical protein
MAIYAGHGANPIKAPVGNRAFEMAAFSRGRRNIEGYLVA